MIVASGLIVLAFATWSHLTGSSHLVQFFPVLWVLLGTGCLLMFLLPLTRSRPRLLIPAGGIAGVMTSEVTAFVEIQGAAPGSTALVAFGTVGALTGLAVGVAAASYLQSVP